MKKVVVKRSSAGLGLFATESFIKDETVIEYVGEIITDKEAQRRGGKYLFELNDDWTIDGTSRKNIARYINHSCKPNCYPELSEDETQVFIKTKRKISAEEELTYNYGAYYFKTVIKPAGCRCTNCQQKK